MKTCWNCTHYEAISNQIGACHAEIPGWTGKKFFTHISAKLVANACPEFAPCFNVTFNISGDCEITEIDTDQEAMALCAIRYCMGRQSYIVASGIKWAREWGPKSERIRIVIARDIREAATREYGLGMEHDKQEWLAVAEYLEGLK
jgi:hypothetical protein